MQQELSNLQKQLDDLIIQQIQPIDPSFSLTQKVESINFKQIQALLPDEQTAIIQWYILDETFLTFAITRQSEIPSFWSFSQKALEDLVGWANDYLTTYYEIKRAKDQATRYEKRRQWEANLTPPHLQRLAEILNLDEILSHISETCNQIILIPHRFLHLLPLHALPLPKYRQRCLLDRFCQGVRYAPSCQLLQLIQNQQRLDFNHLFAIQNPS